MSLRCRLAGHEVLQRGVRNGRYQFGRCSRCGVDLMNNGECWQRVPRGFRVVWRPRTGEESHLPAGQGAFARQVDLRGVTVLGERSYGAQRFALVVLNPADNRSYRALADPLGSAGEIAEDVEQAATGLAARLMRRFRRPRQRPARVDPRLLLAPSRNVPHG